MKEKIVISLLIIVIFIASLLLYLMIIDSRGVTSNKTNTIYYLASEGEEIDLYNDSFEVVTSINRGSKVEGYDKNIKDDFGFEYKKVSFDGIIYYVLINSLATTEKESFSERETFIRTSTTIYESNTSSQIIGLAKKGETYEIIDKIIVDGQLVMYKIKKDILEGYIYNKYTESTLKLANVNYDADGNFLIHEKRIDRLGGGDGASLDYFPVTKEIFEDNNMPEEVRAFYLNSSPSVIGNIDEYITLAKKTDINAFVVDIKDNESSGYKSPVMEKYSITNYNRASNSFENYKAGIKKLKDNGFYVIGRITVFKDKLYVMDHEESAIIDTRTNKPYLHSNTFWPSAYNRSVWEFNVELAKEAVVEIGFNEIQFDYIRFPDRTTTDEKNGILEFNNLYNETKAQAVQQFLFYASDEIHKLDAYVSGDVFGESAHTYVTAYGQYWPAMSNVLDVISGMPYPDHFSKYEYDFKVPVYTVPYDLLNFWGSKYVMKRQEEIPTPAVVRNWIQAYDVSSYKHPGGFPYGVDQLKEQMNGLTDAGVTGGFMTWSSSSSIDRYTRQIDAYIKE